MSREPELRTDPALLPVLDELRRREPIFHRPEFGATRTDHLAMTAEDFWEVGASGNRYSREHVLDVLDERQRNPQPDPYETGDFHCRQLAEAVYLLTYTLRQGERVTRRATIWRRDADGWKIVFHQGTVVADT
ncbi:MULTISPECIES: nuclear transport factor 2 family protein [Rhodanobacter]|uniref:DUF4440 domain-containing protein n=1 Tax=Rhodanobacter hydrolyticus TaxID=2250595 RepID=A0ABW8J535_9GAMM|nr:DUF4440 domain-containing protein [Rhodanobacter sp. 7MK24]MBD8878979.1 DUF4440 domain-containing protein [Rhodanobacter sp. 7MK24]